MTRHFAKLLILLAVLTVGPTGMVGQEPGGGGGGGTGVQSGSNASLGSITITPGNDRQALTPRCFAADQTNYNSEWQGATNNFLRGQRCDGSIDAIEIAAPAAPAAGRWRYYFKTGTGLCWKDSAGVESCAGAGFTVASQAEAEAGADNTKGMTPQRVKQAIMVQALTPGDGTAAGQLKMLELSANGSNFVAWQAPDALGADTTYLVPSTPPSGDQVLQCGTPAAGVSTCAWVAAGGGGGTKTIDLPVGSCNRDGGGYAGHWTSGNASTVYDIDYGCVTGDGTEMHVLEMKFNGTSTETPRANTFFRIPTDWDGGEMHLFVTGVQYNDYAAPHTVVIKAQLSCDMNASKVFPYPNAAGTTGEVAFNPDTVYTWDITMANVAGCSAGEFATVRLWRDNASADNAAADLRVHHAWLTYTAQ